MAGRKRPTREEHAMSGSRIGHTECLSRRGFLKLCGASSAALALTVYTRQPPSSPALPVSASPTPTFMHRMFLPVVSKSFLVSPENPPFRTIQGPVSMDELRQSTFDPGWYEIQKEGGTIDIVNHPVFGKAFKFCITAIRFWNSENPRMVDQTTRLRGTADVLSWISLNCG